jgi:hypothetical protein
VLGGAAPLLAHAGWFLLQWFLPGAYGTASLAGASLTLVWICFLNGTNDQSSGSSYVPKRLRQSQFIEWIKSRIKATPASSFIEQLKSKLTLDPSGTIDAFVYSLKVSRTRADRRRRRRLRTPPGICALLQASVTLPWLLLSITVHLLSQARAPLRLARSVTDAVAGTCFATSAATAAAAAKRAAGNYENEHESSTSSNGAPSASEGEIRASNGTDRATHGTDEASSASEGAASSASEGATAICASNGTDGATSASEGATSASEGAATPDAARNAPILINFDPNELPTDEADDDVEAGLQPRKIRNCSAPKRAACTYAKATGRPRRTNEAGNPVEPRQALLPGACLSIDRLESSTPGLVAQLKGTPTKARYRAANVFVDHYRQLSYAHCQRSLTAEETVETKRAFERFTKRHDVNAPTAAGLSLAPAWPAACAPQTTTPVRFSTRLTKIYGI